MKAGNTIRTFGVEGGRSVVLRTLRWDDLDDLLELINSLVDERADIARAEKVSREQEIDWLSQALCRLEKDQVFYLVAEVDGKVIANSELSRRESAYEKHAGVIGIAIRDGFRDLGIGTAMIEALIKQAMLMGLKVLWLAAFADNKRAIHVYEKVGFTETGRIPRRFFKEGTYIDEVLMTKLLE